VNEQEQARHLSTLGAGAGRQYEDTGAGRMSRLRAEIHTEYAEGCKMCDALLESGSPIIPHESNIQVPSGYTQPIQE